MKKEIKTITTQQNCRFKKAKKRLTTLIKYHL
jgi:hypothetical protein